MKAHSELLSIGLLAICVCMSILKTGAWAQTKAPFNQATYFTFRMEQLKEELKITPEQQRQAKYVIEQETAELMQYACNPTTSRKDKLAQFRGVFTNSESRMRPILTGEQSWKLHKLHDEMLQEFKTLKSPDSCTLAYWGRKTPYQE